VRRLDHVENFFELVEEHDLLEAARLGPVLKQAVDDCLGQAALLFHELHHTISQLKQKKKKRYIYTFTFNQQKICYEIRFFLLDIQTFNTAQNA
jgi:hypothetical protein